MNSLKPLRAVCQNIAIVLLLAAPAQADDRQAISDLLQWFLANVEDVAAHERFWADDLIYTSSDGSRFGKASIIEGMHVDSEEADGLAYAALDVDIRVHDDAAVVAFRLAAESSDAGDARDEYFNTGIFLKREGDWRVIAWQATRIPQKRDQGRDESS